MTHANSDTRLTEERLRSWLDGNQPARERLCIQVLSLDRRFDNVRPRQPKGGPDGGFDIEAMFRNGERALAAVGFRNSPSDGASDLRWVKKKFSEDLRSAQSAAIVFGTFVFMTNVRLTVGARQALLALGQVAGVAVTEVFDREQMRVLLDSPEGLSARYQFLQIPLTHAEQAAFFARWGSDIENLVTRSFAAIEDRLRRLEFMHERESPLTGLGFLLTLTKSTGLVDLTHVRAMVSIAKLGLNMDRTQWHVGVCNNTPVRSTSGCGSGPCLASSFWLADEAQPLGGSASTRRDPFSVLGAHGGFNEFHDPTIVARLSDIDEGMFGFFMNRRLFERIATIALYANEYLIWSASSEQLVADAPNVEPKMPWSFTESELVDPWVRVMPKDFGSTIDFSSMTPHRMRSAKQLSGPVAL